MYIILFYVEMRNYNDHPSKPNNRKILLYLRLILHAFFGHTFDTMHCSMFINKDLSRLLCILKIYFISSLTSLLLLNLQHSNKTKWLNPLAWLEPTEVFYRRHIWWTWKYFVFLLSDISLPPSRLGFSGYTNILFVLGLYYWYIFRTKGKTL